MTNVLYIGNKLNSKRSNLASISVLGPLLEQEGFKLFYASTYNNKVRRMLDMLWSCIQYRKHIDVVLIDTYSTQNFYYAFLVSLLCRSLKHKYVLSLNGGNLPSRLNYNPRLCSILFKPASHLVSPSVYLKEAFASYGYNHVTYIPNSLQLEHYPYQEKSFDTIRLLWVRSFSEIYNPSLAVHVLKRLQDAGYDSELCMVGPDTGDGSFQATKMLAEDSNVTVRFTGKLPKAEWLALAADYNVFINTTNFDNMPVSVIEAMALGLPIVSTNVGGMPYLIQNGKTGFLLPTDDAVAFERAIIKMVLDVDRTQEMAARARAMVEGFDWELVKRKWFAVLDM
ncbi:glycosyltransferase family 4 protein [Bizionia hallyeonensis]|uniref:Glycosyltransferase family 4 protein n=1 Tax=Bizionia hallyeonensis TaxID=1123757 RepID=A0ABW0C6Z1_9FLAO